MARVSNFLYVSNQDQKSISGYSVDSATGALTPLSGFPFRVKGYSLPIGADPSGAFLVVGTYAAGSYYLRVYSIDSTTGALTSAASPLMAASPFYISFIPAGL